MVPAIIPPKQSSFKANTRIGNNNIHKGKKHPDEKIGRKFQEKKNKRTYFP